MEKTEKEIRTVVRYKHHFYCDSCNKYLGTTEEYEDGHYPELGEFELRFYVKDEWYRIEKHFCDDCKNNFISIVKSTLKDLGFEEN